MASLFTSIDCPPQLDEFVRRGASMDDVVKALNNLEFQSGTPGWKAIMNPQTPLDRAFQIYALNLCIFNDFKPEPPADNRSNDIRWERRDKAWKAAATWLIANTDIIKNDTKEKQKELTKLMPEAIRIQCSHELPPGPWSVFPKDVTSQRRNNDLHALTDKLQHLGLNIKIKAAASVLGETIRMTAADPKDYGTLESLISTGSVAQNKNNNTQPGLF